VSTPPNPSRRTEAQPAASLLVVDDEPNIRDLIAASLRFAGFEVEVAANGRDALRLAEANPPDLLVLDVMLPDMDGFTVTRRLRERGIGVPVLFLTALDETSDKVKGLTVGGDDYVTKPFSLEELVARIRAILRRAAVLDADDEQAVLRFGDIELNEDAHEVSRAGVPIDLSPTEFKLLRYLMLNAGRVLSKRQILDHVWEYGWAGGTAIVESYVSYLRRKLRVEAPDGAGRLGDVIRTKRGVGYTLKAPPA
jgi:two-component system OmpR family response regulator